VQLAGSSVYSRPAQTFHRPPVCPWQPGGFFVGGPLIPVSAANRRSRISARQGSLLPAGRVRRPRFPHLAPKPPPSRHGSESASPHPVPCQKNVRRGVRRRDRGQRPTATENPDPKPLRRRQSRRCSRVRWPRFPQLALRPHPSRQWLRNRFSTSGSMPKGVRRCDRGQRPQLQKNRGARATTLGPQIRNDYAGKFTSRRGSEKPPPPPTG